MSAVPVRRLALPAAVADVVPDALTVGAVLQAHAADRPHAVAVRDRHDALTYADLHRSAADLAQRLVADSSSGSPVAILARQGTPAVTAMLGAALAGRPHAVLDPTVPAPARRDVLARIPGATLVVDREHAGDAAGLSWSGDLVELAFHGTSAPAAGGALGAGVVTDPETALAISWTSGSTGRPKGVVHSHRSTMMNGLRVAQSFGVGRDDVLLTLSPLALVGAVTPLFAALAAGACCACYPLAQEGAEGLADFLEDAGVSIVQTGPGRLRVLADHLLASPRARAAREHVRLLLIGGDRLEADHARQATALFPSARVIHRYSTSETNWIAGAELVLPIPDTARGAVPVGWPVPWLEVTIEEDEVVVRGDALATGYWLDPQATARRFGRAGGLTRYCTGDRATWRADGCLDLGGRQDRTIKVNGVLVDPAAVESILEQLPGVSQAAVVDWDAGRGMTRLAAFVVLDGVERTGSDVRREAAALLPAAQVPAVIEVLPSLPVGASGKVDGHTLRTRAATSAAAGFVAPEGPTEQAVAGIVASVLGIRAVGRHDDVFALGADSLDTAELVARLEPVLGRPLSTSLLLENPTPAQLAALPRTPDADRRHLVRVAGGSPQRPALVLASGAGGTHVETMAALAREVGDVDAFVAVPRASEHRGWPDRTVRRMGRTIADDVTALLADRTVVFVGQSGGGAILMEAAHQLAARGAMPQLVVLIDTAAPERPIAHRGRRVRGRITLERRRGLPAWRRPYAYLRAVVRPRRWWWWVSAGAVWRAEPTRGQSFEVLRSRALDFWYPPPYPGDVLVLIAADEDRGSGIQGDPTAWSGFVSGSLRTTLVPGRHASTVVPPNRAVAASVIADALDRLGARGVPGDPATG